MENDVVLEDALGGMPPATAQRVPEPPQPQQPQQSAARPVDLSQPLLDDGDDDIHGTGVGDEGEDENQPQGRRSLVGDLVRTREQARTYREQSEQSQALLRQVMSLPGGMELLQAAATGTPPPQARGPHGLTPQQQAERDQLFQEASELAQDLGLYDAQGQLDVKLGAKLVLRDRNRVQQAVQAAVQPLQQRTLQLAADPVIHHVMSVAEQWGISPTLVEQGLRATPASEINKPEVQQAVLMMALGTQQMLLQQNAEVPDFAEDGQGNYVLQPRLTAQRPAQRQAPQYQRPMNVREGVRVPGVVPQRGAGRPPLFTEQPGGRPRGAGPALDKTFNERLLSTGMKQTDIDSSLSNFVPGAPNRLE